MVRPKPPGYKTIRQWEKEGKRPINEDVIEEYAAVNKFGQPIRNDYGDYCYYKYVSPDNVTDIEKGESEINNVIENGMPIIRLDANITPHKKKPAILDIEDLSKKRIVCFDTETTGFSKWDEILQITIVDRNKTLLNTYIKPIRHKTWAKASEINHIYPQDVCNAPTAKEIREQIREIFESADIIIGHNVGFDIRMVEQCFFIKFKDKIIIDTLDLFKADYSEGKHKLINAVEHYRPDLIEWFEAGAHKSDTDTIATFAIFDEIIKKYKEKIPLQQEEIEKE